MYYQKIVVTIFVLFGMACNNHPGVKISSQSEDSTHAENEMPLYTCPMHHQIRANKPGKCPICGMTLVPVEKTRPGMGNMGKGKDTTAQITLDPREQQLAGIRIDTARQVSLSGQVVLTGTTLFDPLDQSMISAWIGGWIDKMYVRNPGEKIAVGQKLYELYSPDLLSTEKDYLLALKQKDLFKKVSADLPAGRQGFTAMLEAMKQKLLRWGLTESQIADLKQKPPVGKVAVYSRSSGYVIRKMKEQGDYVREGDAVFSLAGNKMLWVQAQLYDTELSLLDNDPDIWVELDAYPGQRLPGKVIFNPVTNQTDSRVHLLNIAISNPDGNIQPGMPAYVFLQTSAGKPVLAIPKSAVIYDEKNHYVWTALPDNRFERHTVQLGMDNNSKIQILQGIKPGDKIVSSGGYLVNSAYILKYGSGVNRAGMTMSDMKMGGKSE